MFSMYQPCRYEISREKQAWIDKNWRHVYAYVDARLKHEKREGGDE